MIAEGVTAEQVAVVSNMLAADPTQASISERQLAQHKVGLTGRLTVLFAGRLSPEKELDQLMRVLPTIASMFELQLVIVGDGPLRVDIEHWRSRHELEESVTLAGYQEDLVSYYRSADILVFPSRSETFGNVIVEAMSYGLAVVTTSVGVVNEWPEDAPVCRFDGEYPDDLNSALTSLIRDAQLRTRLGEQSAAFIADRYSADVVCEQYNELYTQLTTSQATTADSPSRTRKKP